MPLPLPNLDDRAFETLVEESIRTIPRRSPAWTDHNRHDPGITFVELFSWLAEMQRFALNRVRGGSVLKFLKLLGVRPAPAAPAEAAVVFRPAGATGPATLPRGARLTLAGLPFEAARAATLVPVHLVTVASSSRLGLTDNTEADGRTGLFYHAFGAEAEAGSRLYLGFDAALPAGARIDLEMRLFDDFRDARGNPVPRGSQTEPPLEIVPSAVLVWEYFGAGQVADGTWLPLPLAADGTRMLSESGWLSFDAPADMLPRDLAPLAGQRFWLRATVQSAGYELPPRLDSVRLNSVPVVQRETLSEPAGIAATGETILAAPAPGALALTGLRLVQVREEDGRWRDRADAAVATADGGLAITFAGQPPAAGSAVRLISYHPTFATRRLLGRGTGLPGQAFTLDVRPAIAAGLALQVGEPGGDGELRWRDWTPAPDLDSAGPDDPRFVLDPASGELRFGDGRRGAVPPAAGDLRNVRVIALAAGGGRREAAAGAEVRLERPVAGFAPVLETPARGGAEAETLAEATERARRGVRARSRAVTAEDYEALARATPGLRVARAKAIPLWAPGLQGYPEAKAPATVTVVAVPWSESDRPVPSAGFLKTVCRHLDRHRLVTTRVIVVPPEYVVVGVEADLALQRGFREGPVRERAEQALADFLHPLRGGPAGEGWPFGRKVYVSEVYELLEAVEGVDCVEGVELRAQGQGVERDAEGSVAIPPQSLVVPGTHRIGLVRRDDVCRDGRGGCA